MCAEASLPVEEEVAEPPLEVESNVVRIWNVVEASWAQLADCPASRRTSSLLTHVWFSGGAVAEAECVDPI